MDGGDRAPVTGRPARWYIARGPARRPARARPLSMTIPADDPKSGGRAPACAACSDGHGLPGCVAGACALLKCDAEWADYVFNRNGAPGNKKEWWCHTPSNTWFIAERDTSKDQVFRTYLYEEGL